MYRMSVLVVDDEEEYVFTLVERLRLRDILADGVTNAEVALRQIREKKYDVVVMDVKMPGLSGLQAFDEIKREHPHIPVILLTGHGSMEDAEKGRHAGVFDYLMKPVKLENLVKVLRRAKNHERTSTDEPVS